MKVESVIPGKGGTQWDAMQLLASELENLFKEEKGRA